MNDKTNGNSQSNVELTEEREAAIEAAYNSVVEGGWSSVKELGIEMFKAGAAWQRTQAAGVLEGWRLVPVEPTPEMAAQTAYDGTQYSNPFDFDDFRKDYATMLAAPTQTEKIEQLSERIQILETQK